MASRNPIQNNGPAETPARLAFDVLFVGREREISQLGALHAQRKHVLLVGAAGVGKSALVQRVCEELSLVVSARSGRLGELCAGVEAGLGLNPGGARLPERKRDLLAAVR